MPSDLDELESALGYRFSNRSLLTRALTHSSRANETPAVDASAATADNERLEFLGDAILGFLVSEFVFTTFVGFNEGQLSFLKNHLVSATHLVEVAQALDLGRYLHLGRGEESAGGRGKQRILVNAFEAVLAAIYLDGGLAPVGAVLSQKALLSREELERIAGSGPPHDFRAELERLTREKKLPRPSYALTGETGPGHSRVFTMEVRVGRDFVAVGESSSKKAASHDAARKLCEIIAQL